MQAFLYVDLVPAAVYAKPVLAQVKQALPHVAMLDLDAESGELVQHYALKLLQEAGAAVVCMHVDDQNDIAPLMPLLEELFLEKPHRLVLLQGAHARLQRMLSARDGIAFKAVGEQEVVQEAQAFFEQHP